MIKLKELLDENYSHIRYLVADLNDLYYSVDDEKLKKIIMDLIPNGNQYKYTPEKSEFYIKKFEELEKISKKVLKSNNPIGRKIEKIVKGGLEFWNQKDK
jgi:signal transduction histidine kinase